jgi:hypothetical protein
LAHETTLRPSLAKPALVVPPSEKTKAEPAAFHTPVPASTRFSRRTLSMPDVFTK